MVRGLPLHASTTPLGNATLALFMLLLFSHSLYSKHLLRHRSGPAGSPPVSSILLFLSLCRPSHIRSTRSITLSVCHVTSRKLCINSLAPSVGTLIFQSLLIRSISDMVRTQSTHPLHPSVQPSIDIPGASNNPGLAEFLKQMAESMEVLNKQNEELNARFTAAEARNA